MVTCPECGQVWDEWETSVALVEVITSLVAEELRVDELFQRPCVHCGVPLDWDSAIAPNSRWGTLSPSRQRRLAGTLRRLLRENAAPNNIAETIRDRYDVAAFYVRQEPN